MKKIISIILVLCLCLSLTACGNSFGSIQTAMEEDGYVLDNNSTLSKIADKIAEEMADEDGNTSFETHFFQKGILGVDSAIVVEFKNNKDLREFITNSSETVKGFLKDASESDYVNGNCIILTLSSNASEIFKNA